MRICRDLDRLPNFDNAIITIGTFDGVHIGHQKILERLSAMARDIDGETILITFHPHPRLIIEPINKKLKLITTLDEKIELLENYGLDNLVIVPFSREFSMIPAINYIQEFLVARFNPSRIVIGYDHHFGAGRKGNIDLLNTHAVEFGYEVVEIDAQTMSDITISSTEIRNALEAGDVCRSSELLGHSFQLNGFIVRGDQLGRKIEFPTANLHIEHEYKLIPKEGVYAVRVRIQNETFNGMLNIGHRPTVNGEDKTIEVNIFDFSRDIYGEHLRVDFVRRIRDEQKFESLEDLRQQLILDRIKAMQILSD